MPKLLDHGLTVISLLAQLSFVLSWFLFLEPIFYLVRAFQGKITSDILTDNDFLLTRGANHISQVTMHQFPEFIYAGLMVVGSILAVVGILFLLGALIEIISNLGAKKYFTTENVHLIRTIVKAQIFLLIADPFLAGANQLVKSYLGRVGTGTFSESWEDSFADLVGLVIIGVIYVLFKKATALKQEHDLTV